MGTEFGSYMSAEMNNGQETKSGKEKKKIQTDHTLKPNDGRIKLSHI